MKEKDMFYQRQREFSREFHLVLALLAFILLLPAAAVATVFFISHIRDNTFNLNDMIADLPPNMLFYIAAYMLFCVAVFNFARIAGSRGRRITCEKFESLSLAEKQEINSELHQKFKILLFGENRFYYCDSVFSFLHFINYSDIVWAFKRDTAMVAVAPPPDMSIQTSHNISSLVIYDINGKHFTVNTGTETWEALRIMEKYAPNALFGYSKDRLKLAKNDFDLFKTEGKNIG